MINNPAQILQAFFSNNNEVRSAAEKQLEEFARANPNDSIDLHISALDLEAQQVFSYLLEIKFIVSRTRSCFNKKLSFKEK